MDALTHCKAMEAFCRQRAKMDGEVTDFWLAEANLWRNHLGALAKRPKPVTGHSRVQVCKKTARRSGQAA